MSRLIKNEWRPAEIELPTENTPVLFCKKNSREVLAGKFQEGHFRYCLDGDPIEVEWWCTFPRAPFYNFEGGFGSLNQSLREPQLDGRTIDWKKMEYKK